MKNLGISCDRRRRATIDVIRQEGRSHEDGCEMSEGQDFGAGPAIGIFSLCIGNQQT